MKNNRRNRKKLIIDVKNRSGVKVSHKLAGKLIINQNRFKANARKLTPLWDIPKSIEDVYIPYYSDPSEFNLHARYPVLVDNIVDYIPAQDIISDVEGNFTIKHWDISPPDETFWDYKTQAQSGHRQGWWLEDGKGNEINNSNND